ncbi:unnamed protein product [Closterium sp. NIES-53]
MKKKKLRQIDVANAFLYAPVDAEIFVELPHGSHGEPNQVYQLQKSLYGIKQAPRLWQLYLHARLIRIGFRQLPHDQGMYRLTKSTDYILLIVYVDDLLYIGSTNNVITWFEGELQKDLTLTVSSTVTQYLGLNIQEEENAIYLNAAKYADTIAKRFALTPTTISTPYRYTAGNNKEGSAPLKPAGIRDYQRKLGCLLFAAVTCRPDLSMKRLSVEKQKRIMQLIQEGRSYRQIAKEMGVSKSAVHDELLRHVGPQTYDELVPSPAKPGRPRKLLEQIVQIVVSVAGDSGAARGAASGGEEPGGEEPGGAEPGGAESKGAGSGGAEPGGAEPGGAEPASLEPGGAKPEGVEPGGAKSEGAESGGAESLGAASSGGSAGASPRLSCLEVLSLEPASRPVLPVCTARRVPCSRPPLVPGTHAMALRPSSVPVLPPPEFSLPAVLDPESDLARAANPTVSCLLATVVTDPSFESIAASALIAELLDFAAACRLDYATALVAECEASSPPSVGGECALGTDVLEDRQEDFECLAAAVPRFASMLLAPKQDPDAPDIPTPRSYAEAITSPYTSNWQTAMDAEMASWKSTGTYVDAVPPSRANIVDGMWIFRGVDYFHTFSPTQKMTTLWVLLHVAAQRDYELHSLDFSTAFLHGSLHEEIWLRCPLGFTGPFPAASLRSPPGASRVARHTEDYTCGSWLADHPGQGTAHHHLGSDTHGALGPSALRFPILLATAHSSVYRPLALSSTFGRVLRLAWGLCLEDQVQLSSLVTQTLLGSNCEAKIYAGAMATQELRWLTYLLTDLGEQPRSPPVLCVDNKAMIALCQEHRLEHQTKHIALQ